jgi:YD repeat-containing protein
MRRVALIQDVRANARTFHPHKSQLLVGGGAGLIALWNLETGKELARRTFEATADNLAFSPDGNWVASSYRMVENWGVSIHAAADGTLVASNMFANYPSAFAWHPSGKRIAITDYGGEVHLMEARTGKLQTLGRHKAEATTLVFSPSGDYLFTGGWERELVCWDMRTLQRAMTVGLDSYVMQFREDGRACALTTGAAVQLYAFETSSVHRPFAEDLGPRLRHAAFSPDGRLLAAAADKRIGVWKLTDATPGAFADGGSDTQISWTPDGSRLFGSSRDQGFFSWHVESTTNSAEALLLERRRVPRPRGFTFFSMASNLVAWTSTKGSALASLEELAPDEEGWVPTIPGINGLSRDGHWLGIYPPYGRVLHIYRLPGIEPVASLTNESRIAGFSFSPLGEELGVGSRDHVEFWSTKTWERTRVMTNFVGIMDAGVIFHSDGSGIWMARAFRTAGLFDARTLEPIFHLPTGTFPLALSADGRKLAVAVDAQHLQVWDITAVQEQLSELGLDWAVH